MACTYKASRASGSVHWKGGRHVPSYFWSKARLTSSRRSRDIPWDITIEDLDIQWERQQGRCAYTGWPLEFGTNSTEQTASLDRRDSSGGYTPDNIQFVHKDVNVMKTDLTEDRFLAICRTITEVAA